MKRGPRSKSTQFRAIILKIIKTSETPLTIEALRKLASNKLDKEVSWNTIQKYLEELVQEHRIFKTELPHSHDPLGKSGLTIYSKQRV